eukprot:TRINITY_DN68020_c1_g7_i5.p1 TRINITY_DN68020_c1_g7~~TRINITY_DN68020_c1_g7_i5.p1  ORF type:complete len:638 (-),score=48.87 TRINITY_DN68020_c1_g7_i5:230-2143(-)
MFRVILFLCFVLACYGNLADLDKLIQSLGTRKYNGKPKPPTKLTYNITMRDGAKLATYVYIPAGNSTKKGLPVKYTSTPYFQPDFNLTNSSVTSWLYELDIVDCAFVLQAERGCYVSSGKWDGFRYSKQDTEETLKWMVKQPWCNGIIQPAGVSAMGITSYLATSAAASFKRNNPNTRQPVALQAIGWGSWNLGATVFQQGLLRNATAVGYVDILQHPELFTEMTKHESPKDPWWDNTTVSTEDFKQITWPSIQFSAWFDLFQKQNLDGIAKYKEYGAKDLKGSLLTIVGPSGHCFTLDENTTYYHLNATANALAFELYYITLGIQTRLFGKANTKAKFDKAMIDWKLLLDYYLPRNIWYVWGPPLNGTRGHFTTAAQKFPDYTPTLMYLNNANGLTIKPPPPGGRANYTYIYDPKDPIPTLGGPTLGPAVNFTCGPANTDQLAGRLDIVRFTSAPLQEELAITGEVFATLYVSSDAPDTDFMAKFVDVFPNGTRWSIMDGGIRMRWREEGRYPVMMKKGVVYQVNITLWSMSYIFPPGHRLGLEISSSNAPRFSVNPNTGVPLAKKQLPPRIAANTIHISPEHPSHIQLPIVKPSSLKPWWPKVPMAEGMVERVRREKRKILESLRSAQKGKHSHK